VSCFGFRRISCCCLRQLLLLHCAHARSASLPSPSPLHTTIGYCRLLLQVFCIGLPSPNIRNCVCVWVSKISFRPGRSVGFLPSSKTRLPTKWVTDFNSVCLHPILGVYCVLWCVHHFVMWTDKELFFFWSWMARYRFGSRLNVPVFWYSVLLLFQNTEWFRSVLASLCGYVIRLFPLTDLFPFIRHRLWNTENSHLCWFELRVSRNR
jgi:hypothetical protein